MGGQNIHLVSLQKAVVGSTNSKFIPFESVVLDDGITLSQAPFPKDSLPPSAIILRMRLPTLQLLWDTLKL